MRTHHRSMGLLSTIALAACAGDPASPVDATRRSEPAAAAAIAMLPSIVAVTFEPPRYATGTIDGQDGWSSFGAAGRGCAVYDHAVAAQAVPFRLFGAQSLRMSNAVTSGCFGDQTFSKPVPISAGESDAQDLSGSTTSPRYRRFAAQWMFASTVPGAEQPGLSVVASPDRGDGARMSWIQMTDTPTGLAVNFYDYQRAVHDFVFTPVASGLSRTVPHSIIVTMDLVDGPANDVVRVYVDGILKHTGTSWEDYFRDEEHNPTRTVNRILFRTGGPAVPATLGNGFAIDNLIISTFGMPSDH